MATLAVGMVGAGRTRNGLGPFLARCLERLGCRITAISGSSAERAAANAADLERLLGHEVHPCKDLEDLCARGIHAMVIASPSEHHMEALKMALSSGLPTLCEKPLVHERHVSDGMPIIETFLRRGVPIVENCQWPFILEDLKEPFLNGLSQLPTEISMGLYPSQPGRAMVQGMLPHLLSVIQAVIPVDEKTKVENVTLEESHRNQDGKVLRFGLVGEECRIDAALYLDLCAAPPRPAWLQIDGRRVTRRTNENYQFTFAGDGREVRITDPMEALVRYFLDVLNSPNGKRAKIENKIILTRLRLYSGILSGVS